jgi:hypothetical protein
MTSRAVPRLIFILVLSLTASPRDALAQGTAGAYSLQIPMDVRSEAMGRGPIASDDELFGMWGNVASLAWARGADLGGARGQLVPDLADDVYMDYAVGRYGFRLGKGSLGIGAQYGRLEYGADDDDAFEHFAGGAAGMSWPVSDFLTIGAGVGAKKVKIDFSNLFEEPGFPELKAEVTAWDVGLLVGGPSAERARADRLNWRFGAAVHNIGPNIDFGFGDSGDPLPKNLRLSLGFDQAWGALATDGDHDAFALFAPEYAVRLTVAGMAEKSLLDDVQFPPDSTYVPSWYDEHHVIIGGGFELLIVDAFALRFGYLHDDPGEIKDYTMGFGLRLTDYVRVDFASIPQFEELDRVHKWSLSLHVP